MTTSLPTVAAAIAVLLMTLLSAAPGTGGEMCSKDDISVAQSEGPRASNGIPTYIVEIINRSPTGKSIWNIHLSCGWFSSAQLIDPNTFKRLKYDDCLVNGGKPLRVGSVISFTYYTTFEYPLSVSSLEC